jgi:N,N'-diacetyllegionaminate synthase
MKNINHPIILETACGHDGKGTNLIKLIDIAKKANARNIKFQIFNLEERALKNTKEYKIFKKLVLNEDTWKKCIRYAKNKKLFVFADIYGDYSFKVSLRNNIDGFKIHSEDFFNSFFIEKCISSKKPTLIGIGGAHRSEIYDLMCFLNKKNINLSNVYLMVGVQTFPTPLEAHSIYELTDLIKKYEKFGVKFGYADHIDGNHDLAKIFPFITYSAGAHIIEKHFTDNRKTKRTDYHSALDAGEVKTFINNFDELIKTLSPIHSFNKYEKKYRNMFKKSVTLKNTKKIGEKIKKSDLIFVKDTKNPSSITSHQLVDKKIISVLNSKQPIKLKNIEQNIGAIITARTSSNRLPNKAISKIFNQESIQVLIKRVKTIKGVSKVVLATSTEKSDDILEDIAQRNKIDFFRGSLLNVASRYYECAKKYNFDHFLRITGDAILCDPLMCEKAIDRHLDKASDVTFMQNMPYGTAKEVISFQTIETIAKNAVIKNNTEYLEFYLNNSKNFKIDFIKSNYIFNKKTRLTLDFKEDLELFNKIFKHFDKDVENVKLREVLSYLQKNPMLLKINNFHKPKFSKEELNLELKI